MTTEHASELLISRYAKGDETIASDQLWALEVHLESCPACRGRLAATASADRSALLDTIWAGIEPDLTPPATPGSRRWTRYLATWVSPATLPWASMTVLLTVIAVLVDPWRGTAGQFSLVQLLAPVLPVAGVYASWARSLDPAFEIVTATPRAGLYLVLRRTIAVLVVVLPVLWVAGWATGISTAPALLPSLAFAAGTLALGSVIGVRLASATLVVVWAAVVVAPPLARDDLTIVSLRPGLIPVWAAVLAVSSAVVIARRSAFTRLDFAGQ